MLEETQDTEEIIERVAALDIDKAELVACVRVPNPDKPGLRAQEITTYSTMTRSLLGMCDRLRELEVTRVVMEATSDYWKPAFYLLEAQGLDPVAGQRPRRQAPAGPAQDKLDAVWLAKLAERSMVAPSLVPTEPMRQVRDLARARFDLVEDRARVKQRIEKLLEDALIKISCVLTDIHGVSGRAMIEALIAGKRSPKALAELAKGRARAVSTPRAGGAHPARTMSAPARRWTVPAWPATSPRSRPATRDEA